MQDDTPNNAPIGSGKFVGTPTRRAAIGGILSTVGTTLAAAGGGGAIGSFVLDSFSEVRTQTSERNRNYLLEYFGKDSERIAIDAANIDFVDNATASYRNRGIRQLCTVALRGKRPDFIAKTPLPVDWDTHLMTVGGPKSSPSTLISLGYDEAEQPIDIYTFKHGFVLDDPTVPTVVENYGSGVCEVPAYYVRANQQEYSPKIIRNGDKRFQLIEDLALLTIAPSPFSIGKRHFIFSACQGIGCQALTELMSDYRFMKQIDAPSVFDKLYTQVLLRVKVSWTGNHYLVDKSANVEVLEISHDGPRISRNELESRSLYEAIASKRLAARLVPILKP